MAVGWRWILIVSNRETMYSEVIDKSQSDHSLLLIDYKQPCVSKYSHEKSHKMRTQIY